MTNKHLIIILCWVLICVFVLNFSSASYADALTLSMVSGVSYALMSDWGITFTSGSATATGMENFMTEQIESFVNSRGGDLTSVFGAEVAKSVAGKLVVGQQLYNGVVNFVDWLKEKYTLTSDDFSLTSGEYQGVFLPTGNTGSIVLPGFTVEFTGYTEGGTYTAEGYNKCDFYDESGSLKSRLQQTGYNRFTGNYFYDYTTYNGTKGIYGYVEWHSKSGNLGNNISGVLVKIGSLNNSLKWNGETYSNPVVLNPDKEWSGTIGGEASPDTNLDQLLGSIFTGVADNNLDVDGEVIDIPIPTPTPVPIDPDLPLSDVPWEGLDNNLQQLYEQGLEEIGTIGDASDAITDAVADQTVALEDAIADNAGVVSGAIDQAVSDVQTAIGEQTAALDESLTATAEGVEAIAEAIEDEAINWQKFDLRGLFPFCIPFDIYNMLNALDASPTAPHVQLPFVIQSIGFSYMLDLDFSAFDSVAAIMRQMELICYGLALAWATSKVIKW